ncbi:CoA transferase [Ruixingdingia sedimenti]|uniref:CoA transferase n=1 Tax=Ruixingdingia sedimenti TaxID=3073604 RepID=A0ABU1FE96_9RHOB|nr:CoA transferase [Xinfangfangia sp. LG-4]MDR5655218.1 CoA transferase [Xinfangfangia sp. LG-4]
MYDILGGMRVIEGASFVAGPVCGQHLLELGAEVIRFDAIGGGLDARRWPVDGAGQSLFWEGLNKGKKSIAIDLSAPAGRELAVRLITAPGDEAGLFVTNFPAAGFLSHDRLAVHRPDLITARVMGWASGRNAVDYTVNAITGLPLLTGPADLPPDRPVNHVLPAWDLITGAYTAFALLAAERRRRATGAGGEVRVPLVDIAATTLGHLGQIAEVTGGGPARGRVGNDLFGAFGRDFRTRDGQRIIMVGITARQWAAIVETFAIGPEVAALESELGLSFGQEGARYTHRARLFDLVQAAVGRMTRADLAALLDANGICWETYRTLPEAIGAEPGFIAGNPVFAPQRHPSGQEYPTAGAPASFPALDRAPAARAPRLGEHTEEVLAEVLHLSATEIARLHDRGVVAGPQG